MFPSQGYITETEKSSVYIGIYIGINIPNMGINYK